jgi:hypothetical protein
LDSLGRAARADGAAESARGRVVRALSLFVQIRAPAIKMAGQQALQLKFTTRCY